ncbi:MAG: EamA family transporter [Gemmatimonadaceae bacterium]|nr:EamA family transporter [Gemmatimonadaceae bacterium]
MTPSRGRLLLAYITVYVVWGSSYLAIKFAVESMPAFPMAGARNLLAGAILILAARLLTQARGTPAEWKAAAVVGVSLMSSNAAVAFAITRIPSGVASLLTAMTPCWMVLLEWLRDRRRRPHAGTLAGVVVGLAGIALLVGPAELLGADHIDPLGAAAVLAGTLVWAAGSLYARTAAKPASAQMMSGMHMLSGGAMLLIVSSSLGGWSGFDVADVTLRSWFGFAYLVLVASLAGFTAYVYLLTHASAARASTYAFVNPVVAVTLGALFGGEPLTPRVGIAATVIVGAVALIIVAGSREDLPAIRDSVAEEPAA